MNSLCLNLRNAACLGLVALSGLNLACCASEMDALLTPTTCPAPERSYVFETPATNDPPVWIRWRLPSAGGFADAEGIEFDLHCDNLTRYFEFVLRAYTDDAKRGGYHFRLQPTVDSGWGRIVLKKSDLNTWLSGPIRGWGDIRFFELIGVRGIGCGAAQVRVSDIRPYRPTKAASVVVYGDSYIRDKMTASRWAQGRIRRMVRALDRLGIGALTMSDLDLAKTGFPQEARLAVFPMNASLPEGLLGQLEAFVARGGKILYCRNVPRDVARLMSAKKCGLRTEFVFDRDEPMDEPLKTMLVGLVPAFAEDIAAAKARALAAERLAREKVAQFPSKKGEVRSISSHRAHGPIVGRSWDEVVAFAATNNFTHFSANLCSGEVAFYESKVLTVAPEVAKLGDALELFKAACRRHGLKSVGWRCCFTMRRSLTPKEIIEARIAEGRMAVDNQGKPSGEWLCPGHPANRRTEVAAMVELAEKGLDFVSLDFIRYPDANWCFCEGCRARFEQKIGRKVANWPADVLARWDVPTGCLAHEWQAFREETITSLVREIAQAIKAARPGVRLTSSGYMDPNVSRIGEGQNWAAWCREGLIDALGMMDYVDTFAGFNALIREQRKFDVGSTCAVRPTFGPSLWPDDGDAAQALNAARHIQAIRDAGYAGFNFFMYDERAERILPILATGPLKDK